MQREVLKEVEAKAWGGGCGDKVGEPIRRGREDAARGQTVVLIHISGLCSAGLHRCTAPLAV